MKKSVSTADTNESNMKSSLRDAAPPDKPGVDAAFAGAATTGAAPNAPGTGAYAAWRVGKGTKKHPTLSLFFCEM